MSRSLGDLLAWLPVVMLAAIFVAGRARAAVMRRRGVGAVIVDLRRPVAERAYDTLMIAVSLFWIYLLVAALRPLSLAWLPDWLLAKVVDSLAVKLAGAVLTVVAPILYAAALWTMGMSWRIGIDQEKPGPLVTTGLFARTRNPLYTAFDLLIVGSILIHGRVVFLIVGVALMLMIHGIIRREERFLATRYGDAFRSYCARVGRYSPWA